ncbi:alpha-1,3-glucosidase [Aureococcus anophagefferens]|nr:alpha-1,3-glucosidase [Aureococcus anophagefferens]
MNETDFEAAQDALDADEQPDESIRDWIIKFYTEFNPEKLGSVDVILSKYVGREDELVRQLERKYAPIAAGDEPRQRPRQPTSNLSFPAQVRTVEEQQELTYHLKAATETIATYFPPDFEAEIAAQLIAQDALYAEDAARAAMDAEAAGYPETKDDDDDASDDPDAPALPPPEEPPAVRGGLKPPLLAPRRARSRRRAPPRDPDGDASDAAGRDGITGRAYAKMYASARQQMARMTRERNNAERRVLEYAQLNNALEEELALHRAELEKKAGAADGARSESDGLRADLEAARARPPRGREERAAHEATRRDLQEAEAVVDVAAEARREQERWFDEQRRRCEDEAQELVDRAFADSSMLQEELLTRELKNMEARREMVDAQVKARDEEIQRLSELVANLDANVKARDKQVETMQAELHKAAAFLQHEKDIVARAPKAIGGGGLVDDDDGAAGGARADARRRRRGGGRGRRRAAPSLPAAYPDETPPVHGPPLPPNFERKLDL